MQALQIGKLVQGRLRESLQDGSGFHVGKLIQGRLCKSLQDSSGFHVEKLIQGCLCKSLQDGSGFLRGWFSHWRRGHEYDEQAVASWSFHLLKKSESWLQAFSKNIKTRRGEQDLFFLIKQYKIVWKFSVVQLFQAMNKQII